MNVLVVSAHPDDETLGCGGTLLRHKNAGDDIFWFIATNSGLESKRLEILKVREAYGARHHRAAHSPTALDEVPLPELIIELRNVLNIAKPEVIYTVGPGDVHSDHRRLFDALEAATKTFRQRISRILVYETLTSTDAGFQIRRPFRPNCFVDISGVLDDKLEVLKMYESELLSPPAGRNPETVVALARVRGSQAGAHYAEAFELMREVR